VTGWEFLLGGSRNEYKILMGKPLGKFQLGILRRRLEGSIY
jgi:hypothetical protein